MWYGIDWCNVHLFLYATAALSRLPSLYTTYCGICISHHWNKNLVSSSMRVRAWFTWQWAVVPTPLEWSTSMENGYDLEFHKVCLNPQRKFFYALRKNLIPLSIPIESLSTKNDLFNMVIRAGYNCRLRWWNVHRSALAACYVFLYMLIRGFQMKNSLEFFRYVGIVAPLTWALKTVQMYQVLTFPWNQYWMSMSDAGKCELDSLPITSKHWTESIAKYSICRTKSLSELKTYTNELKILILYFASPV